MNTPAKILNVTIDNSNTTSDSLMMSPQEYGELSSNIPFGGSAITIISTTRVHMKTTTVSQTNLRVVIKQEDVLKTMSIGHIVIGSDDDIPNDVVVMSRKLFENLFMYIITSRVESKDISDDEWIDTITEYDHPQIIIPEHPLFK